MGDQIETGELSYGVVARVNLRSKMGNGISAAVSGIDTQRCPNVQRLPGAEPERVRSHNDCVYLRWPPDSIG
jgi:hypothetical protein